MRRLLVLMAVLMVAGSGVLAARGLGGRGHLLDRLAGHASEHSRARTGQASGGGPRPGYKTARILGMSVAMPAGWRVKGISTSNGTSTWTAETSLGFFVQLTATPLGMQSAFQLLPMLPASGGLLPRGQSPYESTSVQGSEASEQLLGRAGTLYGFSVQAPTPSIAHRVWVSWIHPPASSVTQAVKHIEAVQSAAGGTAFPDYARSFGSQRDGWIMVGEGGSAGQEGYVLFETGDAGRTWSLERYTTWAGCAPGSSSACTFLGLAGSLSMTFWNSHDGAVVQATMVLNSLSFYRTQNGGRTWIASRIPVNHPSDNAVINYQSGRLMLTIDFYGSHPSVHEVSTDGGATWVRAPS